VSGGKKTRSGVLAARAKVELRLRVLDAIGADRARVLDAYCGVDGKMYREAWAKAAAYVGCDKEWHPSDTRPRFVGDTLLVLRALDLSDFNVFDVDAYGSPWEAMVIIAARRAWDAGEQGAIVFTDGSDGKTRFGGSTRGLSQVVGSSTAHKTLRAPLREVALGAWLKRCNLEPLNIWRARGYSGAVGSIVMNYVSVVFRAGAVPTARPVTRAAASEQAATSLR
jgi:hypothetical protein